MPDNHEIRRKAIQIENRIHQQGDGFQPGNVITIASGHAVHDSYTAFLPIFLPIFIRNLLLSKTEAGLLSAYLQMPSIFQPVIGRLADRISLRFLVIFAPALTGTMMSLLGVAPGYAMLAVLLIVAGLNSAGLHAVGPVMVGTLSGGKLGRGMGFWMVGGELGRSLGPIILVTAIRWMATRDLPWMMVGGWAATAFLYLRLREMPVQPPASQKPLPWRAVLGEMRPVMIPLAGIIAVRAFVSASITTYLPVFMTEEGADLWLAGLSLTLVEAAAVIGAFLGGSVSDRIGRRLALAISMGTTPILVFGFLALSGLGRFPILFGLGLFGLSVTPVVMALVQESYPRNRAFANGVYMALSFSIRAAVVVLVGAIGDLLGLRLAFSLGAILMLLGMPLILLLPAKNPG